MLHWPCTCTSLELCKSEYILGTLQLHYQCRTSTALAQRQHSASTAPAQGRFRVNPGAFGIDPGLTRGRSGAGPASMWRRSGTDLGSIPGLSGVVTGIVLGSLRGRSKFDPSLIRGRSGSTCKALLPSATHLDRGAWEIICAEGPKSLWRGGCTTVVRDVASCGLLWSSYIAVQRALRGDDDDGVGAAPWVGGGSGIVDLYRATTGGGAEDACVRIRVGLSS